MSAIEAWVRTPAAQGLGWALAHSLWQGASAAVLVAIALACTRSPRARYATGCLALGLMTGAFGWTWWSSIPTGASTVSFQTARTLHAIDPSAAVSGVARDWRLGAILPWLAPFWAVGVLAFHLRALAGWTAARRLRTIGVCAAPDLWRERLDGLARRLRVTRAVVLLESGIARTPVVAGALRPVILVPVGMLAGLPARQVEAILLHELAHIRRHDYFVNVLQTWVEAIFFYHPAAWWISKVIRAEREHCCDDVAAAAQGDAFEYASALAALEQYRWAADGSGRLYKEPAVAATGGDLVTRIRRLLHPPEHPRAIFAPALSLTLVTLAAAATLFAWQDTPRQRRVQQLRTTMESPYRKWLTEDVAYIISDRERAAYRALMTDEEREKFIEQFWTRRDPTPGTVENEFKEEHYRRIAYSNELYPDGKLAGWKTDRGRIYITYGPPDQIEAHPSDPVPNQEWLYKSIEGMGQNVIVRFEDPDHTGEYRQTVDPRNPRMVK
jgi:GWxTD domain-containing protein